MLGREKHKGGRFEVIEVHSEFEASVGYMRPCLQKNKQDLEKVLEKECLFSQAWYGGNLGKENFAEKENWGR